MASKTWGDLIGIGSLVSLPGRLYDLYVNSLALMTGRADVYDDIDFNLSVKTTGAGKPTYQTFNTDFECLRWAVNDVCNSELREYFHRAKENSVGKIHVHFITNGTDTTNRYVKWEIKITQANFNAQFSATATYSFETLIPANTPANTHYLTDIAEHTFLKIGSHIKIRLKRIASAGTAPTNDPFCEMVQVHIPIDSSGSRGWFTK